MVWGESMYSSSLIEMIAYKGDGSCYLSIVAHPVVITSSLDQCFEFLRSDKSYVHGAVWMEGLQ